MIAKEQMFEVYANYDFFGGGVRTPQGAGGGSKSAPEAEGYRKTFVVK